MSGARIGIHDDGYGRLHLKWSVDDTEQWRRTLDDFKATFRTHSERSYNSTTRTWSVPLWCRRRLEDWVDCWFDADAQQWDEDEPAGYGRTHGDRSYGHNRRPRTSTSTIEAAYSHLCLTPDAPPELVRVVHHWWVRALHPDTGHGDAGRMASVNVAIDTIRAGRERKAS